MDAFKGKFERTSADKYEEMLKVDLHQWQLQHDLAFYEFYLQELDVNFLLRKAATVSTPVCEIYEEDGGWMIKTSTTLKTMELKFKVRI